jgi:uncharacterized membrane protein (DUF2068 family)
MDKKEVLRKDISYRMGKDPVDAPDRSISRLNPHFHVGPAWRGRSGQVKVLRAVASLELAKGLLVLAAGFGILFLLHKDTYEVAENLLHILHISPDRHFAHVFLRWADSLTDRKLWAVSAVALTYSALRFVEAYGLWTARAWAEWIALISAIFYMPFEVHELIRRISLFHVSLLIVNLAIVIYMAYLRSLDHHKRAPSGS